MTRRRACVVGSLLATTGCGAAVRADEARPIPVAVGCADRSMAIFPRAFTDPGNLVVGPLVMVGAGRRTRADTVREFGGNKFPLLVRNRRRVTVEVRSGETTLAYGPQPEGEVTWRQGDRAIRFTACRRRSGSRGGRRRVTFWSGFVLTSSPRCVRLRVSVGRKRSPRRAAIALGRKCPG